MHGSITPPPQDFDAEPPSLWERLVIVAAISTIVVWFAMEWIGDHVRTWFAPRPPDYPERHVP